MRMVVAVEPADFRKGIDGLARRLQGGAQARSVQRLGVRVPQPAGHGAEDPGLRRPGILALPQAAFERDGFAGGRPSKHGGGQDAGGPPVAGASFGRQSRSGAGGAGVASGRAGGLTAKQERIAANRSLRFLRRCAMLLPRETDFGLGHGCRRKSLRPRCPPRRDARRWLWQRSCVPRNRRSSSSTWTSWTTFCGAPRGTSRRRLRDAQGGRRVLRLHRQLGGRQEHEHRSAAEDALRREDREDRGGARQTGSVAAAAVVHGRRSRGFPCRNGRGNRRGNVRAGKAAEGDNRGAGEGARPQRGRRLHGRREDRGAARVAASRAIPARSARRARSTR